MDTSRRADSTVYNENKNNKKIFWNSFKVGLVISKRNWAILENRWTGWWMMGWSRVLPIKNLLCISPPFGLYFHPLSPTKRLRVRESRNFRFTFLIDQLRWNLLEKWRYSLTSSLKQIVLLLKLKRDGSASCLRWMKVWTSTKSLIASTLKAGWCFRGTLTKPHSGPHLAQPCNVFKWNSVNMRGKKTYMCETRTLCLITITSK